MQFKYAELIQNRAIEFSRIMKTIEEVLVGDYSLVRIIRCGSLGNIMAPLKYAVVRAADGIIDYIKDELSQVDLIDKQALNEKYPRLMNKGYLINLGVGLTYDEAVFRAIEGLLKRFYPLLYEAHVLKSGKYIFASEKELKKSGYDFVSVKDFIYYTPSQKRQLSLFKGYEEFNPDKRILWIHAENLINGKDYLVPAQCIISSYMKCVDEPVYRFASNHGISLDIEEEKAITRALMDDLTKDSFFVFWYSPAKLAANLSGHEKVILRELIGKFLPNTLTFYINCYKLLNEYGLKMYFSYFMSDENQLVAAISCGISIFDAILDCLLNLVRNIMLATYLESLNIPLSNEDLNDSIEHLIYYVRNTEMALEASHKIKEKVQEEHITTELDIKFDLRELLKALNDKEYVLKIRFPILTEKLHMVKIYVPKLCEPFIGVDQPFLCSNNVNAFPEGKQNTGSIENYSKEALPHPLYFF
ncbi:MAG: YcaO-like family protein [Crenarchaeota archaeon]|nr:YcaO-like family protein [Thermoproteota archaeon]